MLLRKTIIYSLILSLFLVASGCGQPDTSDNDIDAAGDAPVYGGIYRYPLNNDPATLDPVYVIDGYQGAVVVNIHEGLVGLDEELQPIPAIAKSWEVSDDGLTWTFQLRPDVKFHDGKALSSADVIYSIHRLLDPATDSPRRNMGLFLAGSQAFADGKATSIKGLSAPDAATVIMRLEVPFAPILSVLTMPNFAVVPAGSGAEQSEQPVGAGPFRFAERTKGEAIKLVRNTAYHGAKPYLDGITYVIMPNYESLMRDFETGQLEEAELGLAAEEQERLKESQGMQFITLPVWGVDYIGMDTRKPPLNNVKVRQAINHAIDWSPFFDDTTFQSKGILPPGMPGYNDKLAGYAYDPDKARQLLAEAGYPEGLPGTIELWTNNDYGSRAIVEYIRQQLAQSGIQLRLGLMEWNDLTDSADRGELAMFQLGWVADYPDPDTFLYPLFHSANFGKAGNSTWYSNPKVDQLLDRARRMPLGDERLLLYQEAEALIVADAPWVLMYHYTSTVALQSWVHGRIFTGLGEGALPLTKVWLSQH